jgi:hypothetical protein
LGYHNHFHGVLRVLNDCVGVQGRHFVCGQLYGLSTKYFISVDFEIVLSTKLHEHDDFRKDCMWVGADKDVCFSCLAFVGKVLQHR